jgi:hypothetical protein
MKTNQIISSNGNTTTLKLNEFNGLMGPFLQDDNLLPFFSPSLSSTIFETASFSALDVNDSANIEFSIATSQETSPRTVFSVKVQGKLISIEELPFAKLLSVEENSLIADDLFYLYHRNNANKLLSTMASPVITPVPDPIAVVPQAANINLTSPKLNLAAPRNFVTALLPFQVIPMDLDGDGDRDVVILAGGEPLIGPQLQLLENIGDGTLVARSFIELQDSTELVAADLNGDGRLDLAQVHTVGTINGELNTWVQNGAFSFINRKVALPFPASHLCIGNLDGINDLDLVIGDDLKGPRVYTYLSNGAGSYLPGGEYTTESVERDVNLDGFIDRNEPVNVRDCQLVDLNGDGRQDLVLTNIMNRLQSYLDLVGGLPIVKYSYIYDVGNIVVLLTRGTAF